MQDIKRATRPSKKSYGRNAQSAMEYLITYGWAILIVAVALGVLWSLGLFSNKSVNNLCVGAAGYVCSNPVLVSNGVLSVSIEPISGSALTVTGLGCSNSSMQPSTFTSTSTTLPSLQTISLSFVCTLSSNAIGAPLSGTLWVQYSSGTQTGYTELSQFSTQVVAYGPLVVTGPASHYVPITITSSGTTASNFQQMLTINSNTYNAYINSGWTNVEFTTGAKGSGTPLQAWVESNPSNTATSTVVWVFFPSGLASGSTTIYMDFMPSNVMSSSGPTGEAPQLTGTYGQYDNGASVFSFYDDFSSASLTANGKWVVEGSPAYTTGTGLRETGSISNSNFVASSGTWDSTAYISEMYGYQTDTNGNDRFFSVVTGQTGSNQGVYFEGNSGTLQSYVLYGGSGGQGSFAGTTLGTTVNAILSIYAAPGGGTTYVMYNYVLSSTGAPPSLTTAYYQLGGALSATNFYQWVRRRPIPPNNVMPTVSFGTFS